MNDVFECMNRVLSTWNEEMMLTYKDADCYINDMVDYLLFFMKRKRFSDWPEANKFVLKVRSLALKLSLEQADKLLIAAINFYDLHPDKFKSCLILNTKS